FFAYTTLFRSGGPHVGDVVEPRRVLFVADRTHHRGGGGRDRAHQRLVGERQQVLQGTAPTGDDDHVHVGMCIQLLQRGDHLTDRTVALHRGRTDLETHRGPATPPVLQNIAFGGRITTADESHGVRQERQRPFAFPVEDTLGRERATQLFQAGQEFPQTHVSDLQGAQRERAAWLVEVGFGVHHHPRPRFGWRTLRVQDRGLTHHTRGDVRDR